MILEISEQDISSEKVAQNRYRNKEEKRDKFPVVTMSFDDLTPNGKSISASWMMTHGECTGTKNKCYSG